MHEDITIKKIDVQSSEKKFRSKSTERFSTLNLSFFSLPDLHSRNKKAFLLFDQYKSLFFLSLSLVFSS